MPSDLSSMQPQRCRRRVGVRKERDRQTDSLLAGHKVTVVTNQYDPTHAFKECDELGELPSTTRALTVVQTSCPSSHGCHAQLLDDAKLPLRTCVSVLRRSSCVGGWNKMLSSLIRYGSPWSGRRMLVPDLGCSLPAACSLVITPSLLLPPS